MHPFRITAPVCLRACAVLLTLLCARAHAQAQPTSVTIVGTFQSELGCPGDWDPACSSTGLELNATDGVWRKLFTVPGGPQEFKVALNGSWDENYGAHAQRDGANLSFSHTEEFIGVKFFYDPVSHWVTNSSLTSIAVLAGSLQSELGCPADWDPACMITWLKDIDGDGVQELRIPSLPAGSYELKVAHHESWDENYGLNGEYNGANIPLFVPAEGQAVRFSYDTPSHILTILVAAPTATALTVTPNPAGIGETVTLTASVSITEGSGIPTGAVTFRVDGEELGSAPVGSNGVATMTSSIKLGGTLTFTAEYHGTYDPSISVPVVIQTGHRTTTTLSVAPEGPSSYGEQVTLSANVAPVDSSAGAATGEVVFQSGETELGTVQVDGSGNAALSLTTLAVGEHVLSARFVPQGQFLTSRDEASHTVNLAAAQVVLESSRNPSDNGQSVTFTARVSAVTPAAGTPSGSVTFLDGKEQLAKVEVNAQGEASYTTATLEPGEHSITASYSGDTNFESKTSASVTQVVRSPETDAGTGDMDGGSAPDAGTSSDGGTTETDAGSGDMDAGPAPDAGSGDVDAGSGSTDAGSGPTDAGSGPTDAGSGSTDAGSGPTDAGSGNTDAGAGNTDAGTSDTDAGSGNTDAGSGATDAGSGNTDAGTGDTDAGSGNTDAGTTPGTDAGTQQRPDAGTGTDEIPPDGASGCGCGAGSSGGSPLLLLGMWMALTAIQSRRRASRQSRG
ncbi:Ig-like domain repeat protein [Pyxidicoccus parkwayensis]|uniref:Ig-like domain repeat protein n=1 Tax=Pyxidicoccus parkwayensis TaxID=2813578 RepID=A0ABX7P752_9BACT|nr:Ig-like domain repeat protein [Pyxidicoccus parkwaysis]QSQ26293.1 Ig-like domain repeat protein [Pyxidicoccus parkwaysis]